MADDHHKVDFRSLSVRSAPSLPLGVGFRPRQQVKGICPFLMSCLDGERDLAGWSHAPAGLPDGLSPG